MSEMKIIYLDNNATTRVDDEVLSAILPYLSENYFNPSSLYSPSKDVKKAIVSARQSVAKLLGCEPEQIIFTSGGSESNVTAIEGLVNSQPKKKHIITSRVEHASIMETMKSLEKEGYDVTYLPVDELGRIDPSKLEKAIRKDTALVSIMLANNEIGNIYEIKKLAQIAHKKGVMFHTDAVQGVGKLKIDVKELDVDALSLSAHKFYAPKGVGALYLKSGQILPLIKGHQERNMRGGTENVAGIVGLGVAASQIVKNKDRVIKSILKLRDYMEKQVMAKIEDVKIYGDLENRICNTSCMAFRGVNAQELMFMLEGGKIYVSTGSACNSQSSEPSPVLVAIGADLENYSPIRVSLGAHTTKEQIDTFVKYLKNCVEKLRR